MWWNKKFPFVNFNSGCSTNPLKVLNKPLLYYRISDSQVSSQKSSEQRATTESIINEVLEYLMELNKNEYPELAAAYGDLCKLYEKQLLTKCEVLTLFQTLFSKNEKKLNL